MKIQGLNCSRIAQNNLVQKYLLIFIKLLILYKISAYFFKRHVYLFIYVCASECTLLNNIIIIIISFALCNINIYLSESRVSTSSISSLVMKVHSIYVLFVPFNFVIRAARWQRSIMCSSNIRGEGSSYIMFD